MNIPPLKTTLAITWLVIVLILIAIFMPFAFTVIGSIIACNLTAVALVEVLYHFFEDWL